MDPNETLKQLRTLFAEVDTEVWDTQEFERARDLFQALDQWISSGGFLPEAWRLPIVNHIRKNLGLPEKKL